MFALFPRLKDRVDQRGGTLSGGEQQMLAIARALMARPKLLLLDEPSLGLAPMIVKQIFDAIRDLNQKEGLSVFLVEQNAFHALRLAHRGYVMVNGVITLSGTGKELLANPQVRAAIGLTRSLAGSEAEAAWRNAVSSAVDQADNVMRDFDAQFIEGTVSPATVSQRVKDSLTKTRSDLNAEAKAIYDQVDDSVPKQTPVQMDNLFRTLTDIAGEVGESGMTAQEKRLMGLIQSGETNAGDITYGRLIREKSLIGKALKRQESPYGSLDEATLKRLYAALATDQLDNVGRIGCEGLRSQLRGANLIYAKERALGDRIVKAFGDDLEGGIASKMRSAITGAAKGDVGDFARLMKTVPADLRKEVVATALTSASRSARGAEKGGFGFSEFADLYPKLRANPQVYKQVVEALGPKASDTLRDLFQVSKRITEARANVLTTGKANQALVESLNAEGLISKIMDSTTAKRAVGAIAGLGGPLTGAVMPDIMQAMTKGNPDAVRAAGKMFVSPEFQSLLTETATQPEVTDRAINRVVSSQRFRDFANNIKLDLKDGRNWLRSAVTAGAVSNMGTENAPPAGAIMVQPQ
jgi:ABC-type proline/glycine betaine transport system ATPase subunit